MTRNLLLFISAGCGVCFPAGDDYRGVKNYRTTGWVRVTRLSDEANGKTAQFVRPVFTP
jgi:hypothetical protein